MPPSSTEDSAPDALAYVGLGANLGDAQASLDHAIDAMARLPQTRLLSASSTYRSAPVDAEGPDFLNAVVQLRTGLSAHQLLAALQEIELAHGRQRPYRNAPRTLDLDLLLFGDQSLQSELLSIPHPRMHERAFVLLPLHELDPVLQLPGLGPLRSLLGGVADQRIEKKASKP